MLAEELDVLLGKVSCLGNLIRPFDRAFIELFGFVFDLKM